MPVPWTAPLEGQGVYPSQAQFYVPQGISPYMLALIQRQREQQQEQLQSGIQEAISGIGKYMEKRQRDQIANQLLAQQNALPATPVNQDVLSGTPSTALSADEIARNRSLGFGTAPGRAPDLGGMDMYKMQIAAAENQAKLNALNALTGERQAQQQHLSSLGFGGGGSGSGRPYYDYTDPNTGQTVKVTGNRFTQLTQTPKPRAATVKPDPWANLIPTARGNLDTNTGKFVGDPNGDYVKLSTPTGYSVTVPWAEYNKRSVHQMADQKGVNEAAAAMNNEAPLPTPNVPAVPDYSHTIPGASKAPQAAIDYLKAHPETADAFLAKYGYTP